jgi:chromosome segregation ATPase
MLWLQALRAKEAAGAEKVAALTAALEQTEEAMHAARAQWESERADLVAQAEAAAAQVVSLRGELSEHASRTNNELQRLHAEKQQAQTMLASYQSTSAQAMEQIQPLKAMVQKYVTSSDHHCTTVL